MPKVKINKDELWPYYIITEGNTGEHEVTTEFLAKCKEIEAAFSEMQDELRKLAGDD